MSYTLSARAIINTPGALETGPIKILIGGASIAGGTTDIDDAVRPTIDQWGHYPGERGYAYEELRRRLGSRVQMIGSVFAPSGYPGNGTTAETGATWDRPQISEPRCAIVPGQTIAQAAAAITDEIAASGAPDVYVYSGGVGDTLIDGAQMLTDLTTLLTTFRALCPLAHVIVVAAPQDPSNATKQAHRDTYNAGIQGVLDDLGGRGARYWFANPYMTGADDRNAYHGALDGESDIHGNYLMHGMRGASWVDIITGLYTVPAGVRYPFTRSPRSVHTAPTIMGVHDALILSASTQWTTFFSDRSITTWSGGAFIAFTITPWAIPSNTNLLSIVTTGGNASQGFALSCQGDGGTFGRIVAYLSGSGVAEASATGRLAVGLRTRVYAFLHPSTDPSFDGDRAVSIWCSTPRGVELCGLSTGVAAWVIQKLAAFGDGNWGEIIFGSGTGQNTLPASYSDIVIGLGSIPSFDTAATDCTGADVADWIDPVSGRGLRLIDFVEAEFRQDRPIPGTLAIFPGTEGTGVVVGEASGGTALRMQTTSGTAGNQPYADISSPVWRAVPAMPGEWAAPLPIASTLTGLAVSLGNSGGSRTCEVALPGDAVTSIVDISAGTDLAADFETTITVTGKIQQTGGSLSGITALVTLGRG